MSYGTYYGSGRDARAEHEKAWRRDKATAWDAAWHALSPDARRAFLEDTKGPTREGSYSNPSTSADKIPPKVLAELEEAGLVTVEKASGKKGPKAVVPNALYDFAVRIRAIHRHHLLGPDDREALAKYCRYVFYDGGERSIARVMSKAQVEDPCRLEAALDRYVTSHRWPSWAADAAETPLAGPLVAALRKAPGPIPLADLPRRVKGPEANVTKALEALLNRLAAFEDLDPESFDIVVGLLPAVRERMEAADKPRARPPLVPVDSPKELAPQTGLLANDLRVFLLEVVGQPPRLRQDGGLFTKEEPRFLDALPAWPDWLAKALGATPATRLEQAHAWAISLKFAEKDPDDDRTRLSLSTKGRAWLAADVESQYAALYEALRAYSTRRDPYYYETATTGDAYFLGLPAASVPAKNKYSSYYSSGYYDLKAEDRQALRDAIYKALAELPVGKFVTWDSLLGHLTFREHNPLTLGKKDPGTLTILVAHGRIPKLEDRIEAAGRILLDEMLRRRLLPFDAVQAAIDADGKLCVARLPRLDGYFGRKYKADKATGKAATAGTRVIVQPDFSIVVIGLNPAPAVELAPFCDRAQGQAGQGAMIFKLTRESVVRAVAQGMKPAEILARLKKHASVDVPENVLKEVREWADWTRLVNVRPMTVVRCPDAETVARVVSALGRQAQKLGDTLVGLQADKFSSADRAKLQNHGIIITKADITPDVAPDAPAKGAARVKAKRGRPPKAR